MMWSTGLRVKIWSDLTDFVQKGLREQIKQIWRAKVGWKLWVVGSGWDAVSDMVQFFGGPSFCNLSIVKQGLTIGTRVVTKCLAFLYRQQWTVSPVDCSRSSASRRSLFATIPARRGRDVRRVFTVNRRRSGLLVGARTLISRRN